MEPTPDADTITPPEGLKSIAWDGWHDLSNTSELHAMVTAFIQRGEKLALVQPRQGDWQAGWRHRNRRFLDTWGAPLPCPRRALEDATRRFWNRIKSNSHRLYSYPAPRIVIRADAWETGALLITHQTRTSHDTEAA